MIPWPESLNQALHYESSHAKIYYNIVFWQVNGSLDDQHLVQLVIDYMKGKGIDITCQVEGTWYSFLFSTNSWYISLV